MPQPSEIHIDAALTTLSLAWVNEGYVADIVCPRVPVKKQNDKYYIYDGSAFTEVDDTRARGTKSKGIESSRSTGNYHCEPHALHGMVFDEDYKNADAPLRPEADEAFIVQEVVRMNREIRIATLLQNASNYTNSAAAGAGWNAAATDIEADIITATAAIKTASQRKPNTIVLPYDVALRMSGNTQVKDAKKNFVGGSSLWDMGLPPVIWGLNVVIAGAAKNTAKKGQTVVFADIWADSVAILHLEKMPRLKSRSFCVTFDFGGPVVRRFDKRENKATKIEFEEQGLDEKVVSPGSGYLFTNVVQ